MQNGNSLTGGSFLLSALSNKSETTPVPVGMVPATTVEKKMNFGSAKQKVGTITIIGVCAQKCAAKIKISHLGQVFFSAPLTNSKDTHVTVLMLPTILFSNFFELRVRKLQRKK